MADTEPLQDLGDEVTLPMGKEPHAGAGDARRTPMPSPEELSGQLDGYQVLRPLGRGGMGMVYEGIQASIGRKVAIKLLPAKEGKNREFEARFRKEAESMGRLNHPGIVHIYDFGQSSSGWLYIVMELVEGQSLQDLMDGNGGDPENALELIRQTCEALEYAHRCGFVHRDIKPANILIGRDGRVKIADFGIAKLLEGKEEGLGATPQVGLTQENVVMGTVDYIAPERMESPQSGDQRSDLYSLGVLFYQLLTGELPKGKVRPPSEKIDRLDHHLDEVVFKAMESSPEDRYQTAAELRQDVERIQTGVEGADETDRKNLKLRSFGGPLALFSVLLVIVLGALAIYGGKRSGEEATPIPTVPPEEWTLSSNVADLLFYLGEERPAHWGEFDPDQVHIGERLVFNGQYRDEDGLVSPLLSSYFTCSDCHNSQREYSSLADLGNPEAKLLYAIENQIPVLQASTFAGMVNRESWYNDDYARKYRFSPTVRAARKNLRTAIQLCAEECSQGRSLEAWEEEALLAYFWSLQWKVGDLGVSEEELEVWRTKAKGDLLSEPLIEEIKLRFALKSPGTFGAMPEDAGAGFQVDADPDPEVGRQVFQTSCLHCHDPKKGAADSYFRDDEETRSSLSRKFRSSSKKSVYGYLRLGTHPEDGKRLYMPNFTREKLSDFQIESLRAYLSGGAE